MALAVQSINFDGTARLEDGTEVQLVVAQSGALGVRPVKIEDHVNRLDQTGPPPGFDVSGLDQA